MAGPLVRTKLHIPRPRRALVARPRLRERLDRGAAARLTLVSAPPGFGKTTLLADWVASADPVAWLSLDEGDRDPVTFWTHVTVAVQGVVPEVGAGVTTLLQSGRPSIEAVLATLLNELAAAPVELVVVLDDYHLVDGPEIHDGMAFLLDHLPPQVHLVLCTRSDPALPLARLRARGELVEIRAADLRFTPDEATAYLNEVVGLGLDAADIATLEGRTEGWIAALQLAGLSMQGRDDPAAFIAGFAGGDRHIVDYLVEEVLHRQPDDVRNFLSRTCVLDRLTGPLCDAVTGGQRGRAILEALDRGNLFVVPLDDHRRWYRYHHLFADVLRAHLLDERPDEVGDLHRRASLWFERHDEPVPAVRHALAAGDVERAAGLVERAVPALRRDRQEATIRGWLDEIPDELVRARPVLAVGFVGALMARGEFDGVEERLRRAEQALRQLPPGAADDPEQVRLPAAIAMYGAALALVRGDLPATTRHARRAVELAPPDDHLGRAGASALIGLAAWTGGDLRAAHHAYAAAVDGLRRAGHLSDVLGCSIAMADMRIAQGRLGDARDTYADALRLAAGHDGPVLRGTADMHVGLSEIACESGDLQAAAAHLARGRALGEHAGLPQYPYRWRVAAARIRAAEGDPAAALDLLTDAQRVHTDDYSPNVRPLPALRARVLAAQGRWREGLDWAREHGVATDDEVSYLREYEHTTLAGVLLARHAAEHRTPAVRAAAGLLDRLLAAAEEGERTGSVVEILVLRAMARRALGEDGVAALARAVSLAEPGRHVRVFTEHGPALAPLLRAVATRPGAPAHARALSAACGTSGPGRRPGGDQGLVDPLSPRELDVLRLLGTDLDGPDIARRLSVSLNTVRTHTRSIYAKLGVTSRRAAVRRAGELDLLARGR